MKDEQAFPIVIDLGQGVEWHKGMTLRDYYIVHAPAAEIAEMIPATVEDCAKYIGVRLSDCKWDLDYLKVLAKARGEWADAMLKAREAK